MVGTSNHRFPLRDDLIKGIPAFSRGLDPSLFVEQVTS
jgi:hypothetical protein